MHATTKGHFSNWKGHMVTLLGIHHELALHLDFISGM